jgi:hypothetical protein
MKIQLGAGEQILKEGFANHLLNGEGVGGKLWLTDQRLYFKSHVFNYQVHDESYPLRQIINVRPKNTLVVIRNGITISLKDGREELFFVWRRNVWITRIQAVLSAEN